jgi:hemerythrin
MSLLYWDESLRVGIEEIDRQHQKLFEIIHHLLYFIKNSENKKELKNILLELETYVYYHFDTEELFFEKTEFPLKNEHIKEHNLFREKIQSYIHEFSNNQQIITTQLLKELLVWVRHHIWEEDMKYIPYLEQIKEQNL